MEQKREIYLDNSATTKSAPEVNAAVLDALAHSYGNPSSLHRMGMQAEKVFAGAKKTLAQCLVRDGAGNLFDLRRDREQQYRDFGRGGGE